MKEKCSRVVVFTSSLIRFVFFCVYSHSLAFVFIEPFPNVSVRFAHSNGRYNQECRSRLIADGFAFSFGQYESVGRPLAFRVSAYSQNRLVGGEIQ